MDNRLKKETKNKDRKGRKKTEEKSEQQERKEITENNRYSTWTNRNTKMASKHLLRYCLVGLNLNKNKINGRDKKR
jgi:hypothetical protein